MAPQTRSRTALQCFDETRYFMPRDHNGDTQCIAPTTYGKQCSWDISEDELYEIANLTVELSGTVIAEMRNDILEHILLLRVCGDMHREKLEAKFKTDRHCAIRFVTRYSTNVRTIPLAPQEMLARFDAQMRQARASPPVRFNKKGIPRHQYPLPPRGSSSAPRPGQSLLNFVEQTFAPYPSRPEDNMNDVLRSPVPRHVKTLGYVYALTWPSNPRFIKIGYTTKTVSERISSWQQCHSGIRHLHSVEVPFPERMERLVHLEMSSCRHQIKICQRCSSTHLEWFRVSESEVIKVMNDWKTLTEHGGLYNTAGQLLSPWIRRVTNSSTAVTAQWLLNSRKAEAEAEAEALALALAAQAAAVAEAAEAAKRREFARSATMVETICQKAANVLPRKSVPQDWDSILDSFGDFMRLITVYIP